MEPVTIFDVLHRYQIKDIDDVPAIEDRIGTSLRSSSITSCIYDIEAKNRWAREEIETITKIIPEITDETVKLKKAEADYVSRVLLQMFGNDRDYREKMVKHSHYALITTATLWDLTARLMWSFYEAKLNEFESRFPKICGYLRGRDELHDFFEQVGIGFNKHNDAYLRHDTVLLKLLEYRNKVVHGVTGIISTPSVMDELRGGWIESWTYYDHFKDKVRNVKIITPAEWADLVAKSYSHFVDSYNILLGIIERTVEERGKL